MDGNIDVARSHEELIIPPDWGVGAMVDLGVLALREARREGLPLAILVRQSRRTVFRAALPGSAPIHDEWATCKARVVEHFHKSSLLVRLEHEEAGTTFAAKHALPEARFKAAGGAVALRSHAGILGVLSVSGLREWTDHLFCVSILTVALDGGEVRHA